MPLFLNSFRLLFHSLTLSPPFLSRSLSLTLSLFLSLFLSLSFLFSFSLFLFLLFSSLQSFPIHSSSSSFFSHSCILFLFPPFPHIAPISLILSHSIVLFRTSKKSFYWLRNLRLYYHLSIVSLSYKLHLNSPYPTIDVSFPVSYSFSFAFSHVSLWFIDYEIFRRDFITILMFLRWLVH